MKSTNLRNFLPISCGFIALTLPVFALNFEIPRDFQPDRKAENPATSVVPTLTSEFTPPPKPSAPSLVAPATPENSPVATDLRGNGTVAGQVLDRETTAPVPGVAIIIEGTDLGTITDAQGNYQIVNVPSGEYIISFIKSGYIEANVTETEVIAGEVKELNLALPPRPAEMSDDVFELQDFTVTAEQATALMTGIELQRTSATQLDVMSAEDFSRFAASDISDAVKSITGVSLSGGRYPVIRGLNDRYTVTQLDGATMPSPDPDRPAVPLDIFPTGVFESIETRKTNTPDMPGEASGGLLDLKLLSFPEERLLTLSVGTGFNTESEDEWLTTDRGGTKDYFGRGHASRPFDSAPPLSRVQVPIQPVQTIQSRVAETRAAQLAEAQAEFEPKRDDPRPDLSFSLLYGEILERKQGHKVGILLGASQKTESRTENQKVQTVRTSGAGGAQSLLGSSAYLVNEFGTNRLIGTREGQLSAIVGASYEFGPGKNIQWKTLFTQNGLDEAVIQEGGRRWRDGTQNNDDTFDNGNGNPSQASASDSAFKATRYTQRELLAHQLSGALDFLEEAPAFKLDWSFLTSDNEQIEPDTYDTRGREAFSRFRRKTTQKADVFSLDATFGLDRAHPFFDRGKGTFFKVGYYREDAEREFEQLQKDLAQRQVPGSPGNLAFETQEIDRGMTGSANGERNIEGLYLMLDAYPVDWWQIVGGVRGETTDMSYRGFGLVTQGGNAPFNPELATARPIDQDDLIPSLNMNFDLPREVRLRFAYSRTVSRPTFRELQPFPVFNLSTNEIEVGNPGFMRAGIDPNFNPVLKDEFAGFRGLRMGEIHNVDARVEWYPTERSTLAFGVFYKDVGNPIERIEVSGQQSQIPVYTFINNENNADVFGLEIEAQQNIGDIFQSETWDFLSIGGNFTYIDAEVTRSRPETETAILSAISLADISQNRRLFDQPDYIGNLFVTVGIDVLSSELSLVANHTGKRLVGALGASGMDIFEDSVTTLNLSYSQQLARIEGLTLRFTAKNLTNPTFRRITERGDSRVPLFDQSGNATGTISLESYKRGISFSLSASYTF